jgi:shikimate kinase
MDTAPEAPVGTTRATLIGFRGCGKSTVGAVVAARLGWRFMDADSVLEERLGCTIAACFSRDGEPAFRRLEGACLQDLLASSGQMVLATGGGVVLREENREALRRQGGLVVYLEASAALLQERLTGDAQQRPSLTGAGVVAEVPALLAIRAPLYQSLAGLTLDARQDPQVLAGRIARALGRTS